MKIDVQGFELAVLKGAQKALQDTLVVHTEARECDGLYSCDAEMPLVMLGSELLVLRCSRLSRRISLPIVPG